MCSMYCRHCTRRRFAGSSDDAMPMDRIDKALEYIAKTPRKWSLVNSYFLLSLYKSGKHL